MNHLEKSALDQIDEKQYEVEMKDFGITDILKMGIAFKGKDILIDTKCATTSVVRSK